MKRFFWTLCWMKTSRGSYTSPIFPVKFQNVLELFSEVVFIFLSHQHYIMDVSIHVFNIAITSTYNNSINVSVESQSSCCITETNTQDNQIKVKFDSHTDSLCKKLNILKFHDICKLQMGQFIFSWKNGSLFFVLCMLLLCWIFIFCLCLLCYVLLDCCI